MSNLGDSNTPISGDLFGLPSGWTLTENNDGEAVFEDTQGNVVLRRDATNNKWVTDEIDASSATLDSGTIATESTDANAIVRFSQLSGAENIVTVQTYDDLPDPATLSSPVIYRVTDPDDYAVPTTA